MRRSREDTKATREQLVRTGSQLLRERGPGGLGIPALMAALGMTHGGFYRHFDDKLALEVEALHHAFASARTELLAAAASRATGVKGLIEAYLDPKHVLNRGGGCPAAALLADLARGEPALQQAFAEELEALVTAFLPLMPGSANTTKRRQLLALFSAMAGALSAARAVPPGRLRNEILAAARTHFIATFTGERHV